MKKLNKNIILTTMGAVIIGAGVLFQPINKIVPNIQKQEIKAYNHTTTNLLDNIFTENGQKIIPIIFNNSSQSISKENIIQQFGKLGLTVKNISTEKIGTGTQITVNENTNKYNVLIYGDTNGDGKVNLIDAQRIILQYLNQGSSILSGSYIKSANVNNTNESVNLVDAQRVILFYLGDLKTGLVTKEPISDKEKDSEKPVIILKGSNPQKIKLGATYTELGATVTDNIDKNLQVQINSSNVNTNKEGTYKVTYNAKDAAGNKANEVVRDVIVDNYVTGIELTAPTKTNYIRGQAIDTTGMNVKAIMADGTRKNITTEVQLDVDTAELSTNKVTVSYTTNDTIDDSTKKFEKTFNITVVHPISINLAGVPDKFRVGDTAKISIDFLQENENGEKTPIDVTANNLNITSTGFDIVLLDYSQTKITEGEIKAVKYLGLTAKQDGIQTITIKMNDDEEFLETKQINVLEELEKELILGSTNITLYETKPEGNDMVKETDGYVYTLMSISVGNEERTTKIKASDLTETELSESKLKVECMKTIMEDNQWNVVRVQGYKLNNDGTISIARGEEEIDYLGISLIVGGKSFMSDGDKIIITYGELSSELTATLGI